MASHPRPAPRPLLLAVPRPGPSPTRCPSRRPRPTLSQPSPAPRQRFPAVPSGRRRHHLAPRSRPPNMPVPSTQAEASWRPRVRRPVMVGPHLVGFKTVTSAGRAVRGRSQQERDRAGGWGKVETGRSQPQPRLSPFSRAAGWDPPALMPPTSSGCGPSTPSLYLLPPWPTPGAPSAGVPLPMHLCPLLSPTIVTALSCPNRCGLCKIIIRPGNFPQGFPLALLAEAPQNHPPHCLDFPLHK